MGWGGLCVGGYARLATNLVLHSAGARISLLPTTQKRRHAANQATTIILQINSHTMHVVGV